jgi:putative DNA primase/helicase
LGGLKANPPARSGSGTRTWAGWAGWAGFKIKNKGRAVLTMTSPLDMSFVRTALAARAAELAVVLLGEPNRGMSSRRELRFGRHGSLAVVIAGPKVGLWRCHETGAGGDMLALIMRERGGGFGDAVEFAEEFIGHAPRSLLSKTAAPPSRPKIAQPSRDVLAWFDEAVPLAGTPAFHYLTSRGVAGLIPDDGTVLRFHPRCPYGDAHYPCLLALWRDIASDSPRAIHRRPLSPANDKLGPWKALGPTTGAAIKLCPHDAVAMAGELAIAEGVETTFSGMQQYGFVPAWAAGDAGHLRAFPVLSSVQTLTILVDNDASGTGQDAALACSARWTAAGREVFRLVPRQVGADANDLLLQRRRTAG